MTAMSKKVRIKACELAAEVMSGRPDDLCIPNLWSLAVFFERYIDAGSSGTIKDFGPKKPVKLKVKNGNGAETA